jgi:Cys-rich four helix bundle protein (predicted Tat secretion target)
MMNRRDLLLIGAGAIAMEAVGVGIASAAEGAPKSADAPGLAHSAFRKTAQGCVDAGTACLQHCLILLGKGDTSLAECAQAVNEMLAVCKAIGPLAAADSKHLKSAARLCLDVCTDCEKACRPHIDHHAVCKACAEACTTTIAEAKKIA